MSFHRRRGITRAELIAIVATILVLIAILIPSLILLRRQALVSREGAGLCGIHQAWVLHARQFVGRFPVPSDFVPEFPKDLGGGSFVPDLYEDQSEFDTTANVFSVCIMENMFAPAACVSPFEPNSHVIADADFNWDVYDFVNGVCWDVCFAADLHAESNVSYAHMPLFGSRVYREWRESSNPSFAIIGNRGLRNGSDASSISRRIHRPFDTWTGNIVFNDNHVQFTDNVNAGQVRLYDRLVPDNIFRFDDGPGGADAILTFTKAMTPDGPVTDWD